jgi:hypothetical protein
VEALAVLSLIDFSYLEENTYDINIKPGRKIEI